MSVTRVHRRRAASGDNEGSSVRAMYSAKWCEVRVVRWSGDDGNYLLMALAAARDGPGSYTRGPTSGNISGNERRA